MDGSDRRYNARLEPRTDRRWTGPCGYCKNAQRQTGSEDKESLKSPRDRSDTAQAATLPIWPASNMHRVKLINEKNHNPIDDAMTLFTKPRGTRAEDLPRRMRLISLFSPPLRTIETEAIYLSDKKVIRSKANEVIPEGSRMATLTETASKYVNDRYFRDRLSEMGPTFVDQMDVPARVLGSDFVKTESDGVFTDVFIHRLAGWLKWLRLRNEQKAFFIYGDGPAVIYEREVDCAGKYETILCISTVRPDEVAHVAYTYISKKEQKELGSARRP